jgi:hypothetical protein
VAASWSQRLFFIPLIKPCLRTVHNPAAQQPGNHSRIETCLDSIFPVLLFPGYKKNLPIIHINVFLGTRRLSVANHMIEMLTTRGVPAKLDRSHLLIDPADVILHRTQPRYQNLRCAINNAVFQTLET